MEARGGPGRCWLGGAEAWVPPGSFGRRFRTAWRVSADPADRPSTARGAGTGPSPGRRGGGAALESRAHSCPPTALSLLGPGRPLPDGGGPPLLCTGLCVSCHAAVAPGSSSCLLCFCSPEVSLFMPVSWDPDGALQEAGPPCDFIRGAGRGSPVGDVGALSGVEGVCCPAGSGAERPALSHRSLCSGGPVARAARVCDRRLRLRPGERRAGRAFPARRGAQQVMCSHPRRGWEPVRTAVRPGFLGSPSACCHLPFRLEL